MAGFIAAHWPAGATEPETWARAFKRVVETQQGWSIGRDQPGLLVATRSSSTCPLLDLPHGLGLVIGDVFRRRPFGAPAADFDPKGDVRPQAITARLLDQVWGRYVALLTPPTGAVAIFRDPSGALDCVTWSVGGVRFVASDLPDWLRHFLPRTLSLDERLLAGMLLDPGKLAGPVALSGVMAVDPGVLYWPEPGAERTDRLWSPARFAQGAGAEGRAAGEGLVDLVDGCVGAYAGPAGASLVEVSGGLDSAIVASALARAPDARVAAWLNYHVRDAQGDERAYARALASRLGIELTEAVKPETRLDAEILEGLACGFRPALNALDAQYDRDVAERCAQAGAARIITGQGGDTIFYQMPTALILADHLAAKGFKGLGDPVLTDISRWTRRSTWSVLREALGALAGRGPGSARERPDYLASDLWETRSEHPPAPWMSDLDGILPAKRRQIEGLAHTQLFFGACARSRGGDLVHPLLSQPLVEHLLGISAVALTQGGRDRALARRAFADRLPPQIANRRSKGAMTAYYGRMLARSLPVLRPLILEGALARQGLVDHARLEVMLTEEDLIWRGGYASILMLIAVEAWASGWRDWLSSRAPQAQAASLSA